MITPTIRAALGAFRQAANRGTAVYLSPELVKELRDALNAEPEGEELPPNYIDPEHTGQDRELLETFCRVARAEGGTADECILRGIKAVLTARPSTPPAPQAEDAAQCETCHGLGTIDERLGGYSFSNPAATCPDCDGVGEPRRFHRSAPPQPAPQAGEGEA